MIRILTALVAAAILIAALLAGGWVLTGIALAAAIWGQTEVYRAFGKRIPARGRIAGYGFLAAFVPVYYFGGMEAAAFLWLISFMVLLGGLMLRSESQLDVYLHGAFTLVYPALFFALLLAMILQTDATAVTRMILLSAGAAFGSDTFAFTVGTLWGKRKLLPQVSPKKTVEGAAAGLLGGVAFCLAVGLWLLPWWTGSGIVWWQAVVVGLAGSIAGQLGDLAASLIKRSCGVKDFGHLLPGHGGLMDRVDGFIWAAAVVYGVCRLLGW